MNDLPPRRLGSVEIAGLIRQEIEGEKFSAGERLPPERILSGTHKVARGTVREALTLLSAEGLIEVRPGSGAYVTEAGEPKTHAVIQNTSPLNLMDARFALEPHICRLAVLHARPQDFTRAEVLIEKMESSLDDPTTFSNTDTDFHIFLSEITGNSLLQWIISQMNAVRNQEQWSQMRQVTLDTETIKLYNRQHREIVEAIQRREPELAASRMKVHLETARLSLTRAASA